MISLDAIKGLLAEQWDKDVRTIIERLQSNGIIISQPAQTLPHWMPRNSKRVTPNAR